MMSVAISKTDNTCVGAGPVCRVKPDTLIVHSAHTRGGQAHEQVSTFVYEQLTLRSLNGFTEGHPKENGKEKKKSHRLTWKQRNCANGSVCTLD